MNLDRIFASLNISLETQKPIDRKKAARFLAVSVIGPQLISIIFFYIIKLFPNGIFFVIFSNILSIFPEVLRFAVPAMLGYMLTSSVKGTLRFLGITQLAVAVRTMVYNFFNIFLQMFFGDYSTGNSKNIVSSLVSIVIGCVCATFAIKIYTLLELDGKNTKMTSSVFATVKKHMIIAIVAIYAVSFIFSLILTVPMNLLSDTVSYDVMSVTSVIIQFITSILPFGILYFLGKKIRGNIYDAGTFASAYYFPAIITGVFQTLISTVYSIFYNILQNTLGYYQFSSVFSVISFIYTGFTYIIGILGIVITFLTLKYFFNVDDNIVSGTFTPVAVNNGSEAVGVVTDSAESDTFVNRRVLAEDCAFDNEEKPKDAE